MNDRLKALADAGVSIWLDDLSRGRLKSGNLAEMIADYYVSGVTTNPTIFAAALAKGADYAEQLQGLTDVDEAITACTTTDVRDACDLFADAYRATKGFDGRVSIEVAPTLAHDTEATIAQAKELHGLVDRDNVLIKIPATKAGLPAITETIAAGISVNVTLIFSEERYREVMDAYLAGLEKAAAAGIDLSGIHSVASFFISRVDSEIDKRLAALGKDELKGKAAIANAEVALGAYDEVFGSERYQALAAQGANVQRPLWASTGTKDPAYPDTLYVSDLVADGVVNTMPEKTLLAFADHGEVGPSIQGKAAHGAEVLAEVAAAGVDLPEVFEVLETEGVDKFIVSWHELQATVKGALEAANA
ncbi:transaldolase [Propioniciclava coleopterorum]|uniref:Transaldolase n=1 Tax=Propioniciclava coleopterorum TaxID=2714937 RepID=A0A6G7Y852_9ACTN|nr:transaldolase [Propioniciclava coleopterorum]QIK72995.1 transaldolase [Propioniciclava coleopterorum]